MADGSDILTYQKNDFSTFMCESFKQMRDNNTLTDFKLIVDQVEFPCHRLVICSQSPILNNIVTTDMKEAAKQKATLGEYVTAEIMPLLMDYMYTGKISVASDQLVDLLKAAHYLDIAPLVDWCLRQIHDRLKPENALEWFKVAEQRDFEEKFVVTKKYCTRYIFEQFREVIQQDDFLVLDDKFLQVYMRQAVKYKVSHDHVLSAIIRWVAHDATHRMDLMKSLLVDKALLNKCSGDGIRDTIQRYRTFFRAHKKAFDIVTDSALRKCQDKRFLVIVGGMDEEDVNHECWQLNGQKMERMCSVPYYLTANPSVCQTDEGFVITGGRKSKLCLQYNAVEKSWSSLPSLRRTRHCHGSAFYDGTLYVLGGYIYGDERCQSFDFINLPKGVWQRGGESPKVISPKIAQIDGWLYVLDAWKTKQMCKMNLKLNEVAWKKAKALPVDKNCRGFNMIAFNGKLLVAGGVDRICAWYQPDSDTWRVGKSPLFKHNFGAMVQYKGSVLLMGGSNKDEGSLNVEETISEFKKWSITKWKMPAKLESFYVVLLQGLPYTDESIQQAYDELYKLED